MSVMRLLTFSTLYPNSVVPSHGIFVETRLRQLLASAAVAARVIAPVPWFPFRHRVFGGYARYAAVPRHEQRHGLSVDHPRYLMLPKIGMNSAPHTLARAGLAAARRLIASGYDFDLIDAHYFYPDGVAATMIGAALGKPVVITARGTDINLIPSFPEPRRLILDAARNCAAMIAVSSALKEKLGAIGADTQKVRVLRNGVDLALFHPENRDAARAALGVSRYALASVGNLISTKGHHLAIEALTQLANAELFIAGMGPEEASLRQLAARLGVADRVRFLGVLSQDRLGDLYAAADCLVLASEREGWPNVLLEAMACGTPVVASAVGGVPEILASPEVGRLVAERTVTGLVSAIRDLMSKPPDRSKVRRYAERFSWDETVQGLLGLFREIVAVRAATRSH